MLTQLYSLLLYSNQNETADIIYDESCQQHGSATSEQVDEQSPMNLTRLPDNSVQKMVIIAGGIHLDTEAQRLPTATSRRGEVSFIVFLSFYIQLLYKFLRYLSWPYIWACNRNDCQRQPSKFSYIWSITDFQIKSRHNIGVHWF